MTSIALSQYQYVLYKGKKKQVCPECGKRTFVPFIDTVTGDQLPEKYGRCDREINCAYFLSPYKERYNKPLTPNYNRPQPARPAQKILSAVKVELLKQSRTAYEKNNFVQWLISIFNPEITSDLISRYHISTSKHWPGATIFWQIDKKGRIRSGKIMLYNQQTGRRIKEPYPHVTWVHKALKLPDFELSQCFFGEHLLNTDIRKPVAIVESEKTAIIASVYLPNLIWLAVGSLTGLNGYKCQPLAGRNVFLFPDLNGFDKWTEKEQELKKAMPGTSFKISDYLQKNAPDTDKQKGYDIADYLIRFNPRDFVNNKTNELENQPVYNAAINTKPRLSEKGEKGEHQKTTFNDNDPIPPDTHFKPFRKEFAPLWDITELQSFFTAFPLPAQPIRLNNCNTITNIENFIDTHLEVLKHNNGNRTFAPYYHRLIELKQILINKF